MALKHANLIELEHKADLIKLRLDRLKNVSIADDKFHNQMAKRIQNYYNNYRYRKLQKIQEDKRLMDLLTSQSRKLHERRVQEANDKFNLKKGIKNVSIRYVLNIIFSSYHIIYKLSEDMITAQNKNIYQKLLFY